MSSIASRPLPPKGETLVAAVSSACLSTLFITSWATIGAQVQAPTRHDIFGGAGCFAKGMMLFAVCVVVHNGEGEKKIMSHSPAANPRLTTQRPY